MAVHDRRVHEKQSLNAVSLQRPTPLSFHCVGLCFIIFYAHRYDAMKSFVPYSKYFGHQNRNWVALKIEGLLLLSTLPFVTEQTCFLPSRSQKSYSVFLTKKPDTESEEATNEPNDKVKRDAEIK